MMIRQHAHSLSFAGLLALATLVFQQRRARAHAHALARVHGDAADLTGKTTDETMTAEANRLCDRVRRMFPSVRILSPGVQKLPLILEQSDFLSASEVSSLVATAAAPESKFEPSTFNDRVDPKLRRSDSISLQQTELMDQIAHRVATILDVKPHQVCNDKQRAILLRYKPSSNADIGVGVAEHTDYCCGYRRIYTCLVYLTEHSGGQQGITTFKPDSFGDVSLSIRPRRGKLVLFRVASRDTLIKDDYAIHCASGLRSGDVDKLVCQIFVKA